MISILKSIRDIFLDLVFPKTCVVCGKYHTYLCNYCKKKYIKFYTENTCHVCKGSIFEGGVHWECKEYTNLSDVRICLKYSKTVEKILQALKYHFFTSYADLIVDLMMENLDISSLDNSILIPIPLHNYKRRKRGFNQTELIADKLKRKLENLKIDLEVMNVLKRVRNTKTQVGMSKIDRIHNLSNAFEVGSENFKKFCNSKLILVDDVMTTGTTLEACAEVLKNNGFKNIEALVFARG